MSKGLIFIDRVQGLYLNVLVPSIQMAKGRQLATRELLRFILKNHLAYKELKTLAKQDGKGKSIYKYLNDHLAEMTQKASVLSLSYISRHFFFYSDFFSNRSPLIDVHIASSIISLNSNQSVNNLALYYYSAMEFIALQTLHIVKAINSLGHSISSLYILGSQCQNLVLMLLIATICRMPIVILEYVGAAVVYSAAMLGAKATSTNVNSSTKDLWSIIERINKPIKLIQPSTDTIEKASGSPTGRSIGLEFHPMSHFQLG